jgi:mono/diheme cytochrome c family protein
MTDNLAAPETRVCLQHVMPHSKLTHKLFWTSVNPHQPGIFQLFGDTYATGLNGWNGTLCGNFTPGGQTPVTDFTTKIQPIFTANCAVCHAGNSAPPTCKPMNLSSGNAYANIVNVTAGELATMNRITPNNPSQSYLFHKINGTQGGLGGLNNNCNVSGQNQQMPPPSGGLSGSEIADIMSWINTGATP